MAESVKALLYICGGLKQNFFYNLPSEVYLAIINRQNVPNLEINYFVEVFFQIIFESPFHVCCFPVS